MKRPVPRSIVVLLGVLLVLLGAGPAQARERITRGDAQAVLGAALPGFWRAASGPADAVDDGIAIFPFQDPGAHYCTLDWHTVQLSLLLVDGDLPTHQEELADLLGSSVTFTLDGTPLTAPGGPVQRLHLEDVSGFGRLWGTLVPPGSLVPGEHVLDTVVQLPPFQEEPAETLTLRTTFVIDAADEGTRR